MLKKNVIAAMVGLAVSTVSVSAYAATLSQISQAAGPVQFYVNILDQGTTSYSLNTTNLPCTSVTGCDDVAGGGDGTGTANGSVGATYSFQTTSSEDSWGIFEVTKITVGSLTWTSGEGGNFLTGMFYGINDNSVSYDSTSGKYTSWANTGTLDMYVWNTARTTNPTTNQTTGRDATNSYNNGTADTSDDFTGTSANLWLKAYMDVFRSIFEVTGPTTASADTKAYLSVDPTIGVGGQYDTDLVNYYDNFNPFKGNLIGVGDFYLTGTPQCLTDPQTFETSCGEWTTAGNLSVTGIKIPEPGSLALAGLGLFGLAALRRRKQA